MALITLTTDLGTRDYYVSAIKGAIMTHCERYVPMVDITHSVPPFNIREAAYTIRNSYRYFPQGTIHLVHVNAVGGDNRMLLSVEDGHYFLTFDNGLLSLIFGKTPLNTYQINEELLRGSSLLFENAIGQVINFIEREYRPGDIGHLVSETKNLRLLQPVTSPGVIKGTVSHIDYYGNAVTNITQAMFDEFIGERSFGIYTQSSDSNRVYQNYSEVDEGELVCLFNHSGLLEIAINKGKAAHLLGLQIESAVRVVAD